MGGVYRVLCGQLGLNHEIRLLWAVGCILALVIGDGSLSGAAATVREGVHMKKGYGVRATGLTVAYPKEFQCPPLTSFYASWTDIDGEQREEIHSGVDGGDIGDWILAPADGTVVAAWRANWGWGWEGALLIRHTPDDTNMPDGPAVIYSEFDHLKYDHIRHIRRGDKISRGQRLARVDRPGGYRFYLPEVHWEVWEADHNRLRWKKNRHGGFVWINNSARLIDPLYMLGLHSSDEKSRTVEIQPFVPGQDYRDFRGFTYILECAPVGEPVVTDVVD